MSKAKQRCLTFPQKLIIMKWLKSHTKELQLLTRPMAAKVASEQLDIPMSPSQISDIANAAKVKWPRVMPNSENGNKPRTKNFNDGFTRDAELAKAIRELAEVLEFTLSNREEINLIISRRTPDAKDSE